MTDLNKYHEELTRFLHNEGDGGVWESFDRTNAETVADVLLNSPVMKRIAAEVWDEAHDVGFDEGYAGTPESPNPYRTEKPRPHTKEENIQFRKDWDRRVEEGKGHDRR